MTTIKEKKKKEETKDGEYLITYTRHLEKRLRNLETEKQLLDAERLRLEQELHSLRNEIDRLREPPLVSATIIDFLDDKGRAIVKSSTGPSFVVNMSRKVKNEKLTPGTRVANCTPSKFRYALNISGWRCFKFCGLAGDCC